MCDLATAHSYECKEPVTSNFGAAGIMVQNLQMTLAVFLAIKRIRIFSTAYNIISLDEMRSNNSRRISKLTD